MRVPQKMKATDSFPVESINPPPPLDIGHGDIPRYLAVQGGHTAQAHPAYKHVNQNGQQKDNPAKRVFFYNQSLPIFPCPHNAGPQQVRKSA